jgi:hypothetical protein
MGLAQHFFSSLLLFLSLSPVSCAGTNSYVLLGTEKGMQETFGSTCE